MDVYEEFNQIKTIMDFNNFRENTSVEKMKKICMIIESENNEDNYIFNREINELTKKMAIEVMGNPESSKRVIRTEKNTDFAESLILAENVIMDLISVGWVYEYINQEDGKTSICCDFTVMIDLMHNKELLDRNQVLLIAKYIYNNRENLCYQITEKLVPFYTYDTNRMINESLKKLDGIIKEITPKLIIAEEGIKSINKNMISIMALFLTAFSIIGVNIYSLDADFKVNQIILVNSSLVFVLSFLMYLLDKIINNGKAKLGKTIFLTAGILIAVLIWNR